jgi:hypothetical protein
VLTLSATGAAKPRAELRLQSLSPLVVRATGFGGGETVRLTAAANGVVKTARTTAKPNGRFSTRFELRLPKCTELTIRAVGNRGSRAILQKTSTCKQPKAKKPPKRKPARAG